MVDTDFAWRLTQGLVRIDSSDPGAYEGEIERYIKALVEERLAQLSHPVLDAVQIAELEVLPGRRNLMVTVPGQSDEPRLVYICHMDTVTLGDGWDADITPLGAVVRDGKLYGRGACDMKGGLACAIAALVHTLERVAADGALPRRGFSLICSVDEEDFMRGSEAAIDAGWVGSREWVLDTEPTDGQIQASHVSAVTDAEGNPAKDAEMESFINGIKSQYEESLKVVLGRTDVDLMDKDPETGLRAVRKAETNLGDLCADASRYMMGADIGFMNGGGIRAGIEAGDITYEDALSVFPYGNMICMAEVSGQKIKDALEMGVKNYPEESGGFIHVSGLTYTVDSSVPSSVVLDEKRNFVSVGGEYRVRDIYVGEEPLDVNRTYTLASHNYWLKSGGDGMSMLMGCPILKDETMVDVDTITSYISEYLGGTVGEEYKDPRGQGRITIK